MSGSYKQTNRVAELTSPVSDPLVLRRFWGTEAVSELFEFQVEALLDGENRAIDFNPAIGKNVTVKSQTIGHGERFFVGTLAQTSLLEESREGSVYQLTLRPWLWLLGHRMNSRVFHKKTVVQVIEKIFADHPYAKYELPSGSFPTIEYVVQHNESDLDFVLRLMESHGIHYHFQFKQDEQKMVMGDTNSAFADAPGKKRPFLPQDARHTRNEERIYTVVGGRTFTTGKVLLNDYDFKKPTEQLKAEATSDVPFEPVLESYFHPYSQALGENTKRNEGEKYAKHWLNAMRSRDGRLQAAGDTASLGAGMLIELKDHPTDDGEYIVTSITHSFAEEHYRSGVAVSPEPYSASLELQKESVPFAPMPQTQAPYISGVQQARVVGSGEIDVDEFGRIEVCFAWMQTQPSGWSRSDEEARSMRVRVAQVWAGKEWGAMFIPRRGMEVLVSFLNGNPDYPVVIGCLYNADNMPPFQLEGKKNIAGWKSDSTEGGGGYNEFSMDDTKGSEKVTFHAQKDLDSTIENNETRLIKSNRDTTIKANDKLTVTQNIEIEAFQSITLKVGTNKIVMNQAGITIEGLMIKVDAKTILETNGMAMAKHTSGGPMIIKGAILMIN